MEKTNEPLKICFVGPSNSAHLIKWCGWFHKRGHKVHLISFLPGEIPGITMHPVEVSVDPDGSDLGKLKYLLQGKKIRRCIEKIRPDIVNVHYATSYGAALALGGERDYVLSVWGSDVYEFPRKSVLHKKMLEYSLKHATHLFSTSRAMVGEAGNYTERAFDITPFGVDMNLFTPAKRKRPAVTRGSGELIIGTVKSLSETYGISSILKAVAMIRKEYPDIPIRVRIAGKGPDESKYHQMTEELGIAELVTWLGFISQEEAADEWANMDIAVIPSNAESFGVAAVEAQASGTPVIISDIPGLLEATKPDTSSVVVPRSDHEQIAKQIVRLYEESELRFKMGQAGVEYVRENYELDHCFQKIEDLFQKYKRG